MAAEYYVVFMRETEDLPPAEATFEKAKILSAVQDARVVKLEAENVLEAQQTAGHFYPGEMVGTPVVVTVAQFEES